MPFHVAESGLDIQYNFSCQPMDLSPFLRAAQLGPRRINAALYSCHADSKLGGWECPGSPRDGPGERFDKFSISLGSSR
jgi:hypothetical protein